MPKKKTRERWKRNTMRMGKPFTQYDENEPTSDDPKQAPSYIGLGVLSRLGLLSSLTSTVQRSNSRLGLNPRPMAKWRSGEVGGEADGGLKSEE